MKSNTNTVVRLTSLGYDNSLEEKLVTKGNSFFLLNNHGTITKCIVKYEDDMYHIFDNDLGKFSDNLIFLSKQEVYTYFSNKYKDVLSDSNGCSNELQGLKYNNNNNNKQFIRTKEHQDIINKIPYKNKVLVILVGISGSGKSMWVRENNLSSYTLSTDSFRLLYGNPLLTVHGTYGIDQSNNTKVFDMLFQILEERMKKGLMTIIDATHLKEKSYTKYLELAKQYGYSLYYKKFDISLEEAIERQIKRDPIQYVHSDVVKQQYINFQNIQIPSEFKEIQGIEDLDNLITPIDCTSYKNIYCIGDIQGCSKELKQFLDTYYNDDSLFVFTGDLLDRGYDNKGVLEQVFTIMNNKNVIFIEGNHDSHLKKYAYGVYPIGVKDFDNKTYQQIKDIDVSLIKQLVDKFQVSVLLSYTHNRQIFITHGGVPFIPMYIHIPQAIKGVGEYSDSDIVDMKFEEYSLQREKETGIITYSVHGHRNINNVPSKNTSRTYNTEGKVEFGGELRIAYFSNNNTDNEIIIPSGTSSLDESEEFTKFKSHPLIRIKTLDSDLYSVNFTREAFYSKTWDSLNITARGLFMSSSGHIYARSYNKFFNINERPETELDNVGQFLGFPISVYKKYNGFLGIIGSYNNTVLYCSKSENKGIFSDYVKEMLSLYEDKMKTITDKGYSLVFEVCHKNDIHITYEEPRVILLDIIKNDLVFTKYSYEDLLKVGKFLGVEVKEQHTILYNEEELQNFLKISRDDRVEGYVLEGSTSNMAKTKTDFYLFWKEVRTSINRYLKYGEVNNHKEFITTLLSHNIDLTKSIPEIISEFEHNSTFRDYKPIKQYERDEV